MVDWKKYWRDWLERHSKMSTFEIITRNMTVPEARAYKARMSLPEPTLEEMKGEARAYWEKLVTSRGEPRNHEDLMALETEACFAGYTPPHFAYAIECITCGWVLTPYPEIKTTSECPWCRSGFTEVVKEELR